MIVPSASHSLSWRSCNLTGDTDNLRPGVVGNLTCEVADSTTGGGDHDCLGRSWMTDACHAEIRREAIEAKRTEIVYQWVTRHNGQRLRRGDYRVLLPERITCHDRSRCGTAR
jgi:hypothetical protein